MAPVGTAGGVVVLGLLYGLVWPQKSLERL